MPAVPQASAVQGLPSSHDLGQVLAIPACQVILVLVPTSMSRAAKAPVATTLEPKDSVPLGEINKA
jgi:hypothetical protein